MRALINYRGLTTDGVINHIVDFVTLLWQNHPFREGNTRTTAVFVIKYLRSIGFEVNNDLFAENSWYFRNALVRANYRNPLKNIEPDRSFLIKFFRNLMLGEQNDLKNRYMLIGYARSIGIYTSTHTSTRTSSRDSLVILSENVKRLVLFVGNEERSVKEMMEAAGLKNRSNFLIVKQKWFEKISCPHIIRICLGVLRTLGFYINFRQLAINGH